MHHVIRRRSHHMKSSILLCTPQTEQFLNGITKCFQFPWLMYYIAWFVMKSLILMNCFKYFVFTNGIVIGNKTLSYILLYVLPECLSNFFFHIFTLQFFPHHYSKLRKIQFSYKNIASWFY